MAQDSTFDLFCLDDSHFSTLFQEDGEEEQEERVLLSDDTYADYLQFQETLIASFITSQMEHTNSSSSSILLLPSSSSGIEACSVSKPEKLKSPIETEESSSQSQVNDFISAETKGSSQIFRNQIFHHSFCSDSSSSLSSLSGIEASSVSKTEKLKSPIETEESSSESQVNEIVCEICAETRGYSQMFTNQICHHSFCSDCVTKQIAMKIQDSISVVSCPGLDCKAVLEIEACRPILPKELLERWEKVLCESLFLEASKFYCPFKDCSAMLLIENEEEEEEAIRETECPVCHRLFCARCNVAWHCGVECEEFQKLNENEREREDLLVRELANEKKWRRCPHCMFFVEKIDGCLHITCRCQYEFCYECGDEWTSTHGGCQRN